MGLPAAGGRLALLAVVLLLPACLPWEPAGKTAALEARLEALEKKIEEKSLHQDSALSLLTPRLSDLEQRIEDAEKSRSGERAEGQAREQEMLTQLRWMQRLYDALDDAVISGERAVGLSVTEQNLVPTLTRYGTFLFKLTGSDKGDSGYDLHLMISNITPFRIHRFRLHGDFGRKGPALPPEATTRQRIESLDAWELSLARFAQDFETVLEPQGRHPLVLRVPAAKLADLEFIRLWIDVQAVTLPTPAGAGSYSTFDASRADGATLHVLPSDAGTFYLKLEKTTPVTDGQQLTFRFGNPLGMTIDRIRLHGTVGKKPPQSNAADSPEKRELAQLQWRQSRRPFVKEIRAAIKPMQWTEISVELPAATPAELEQVECRVDVLELHLMQKGN